VYAVLNRRTLLPVVLRNGGENSQMGGMTRFYVCVYSIMMRLYVCIYIVCVFTLYLHYINFIMCVYMSLMCDMTSVT